jgi:hypothetical protein
VPHSEGTVSEKAGVAGWGVGAPRGGGIQLNEQHVCGSGVSVRSASFLSRRLRVTPAQFEPHHVQVLWQSGQQHSELCFACAHPFSGAVRISGAAYVDSTSTGLYTIRPHIMPRSMHCSSCVRCAFAYSILPRVLHALLCRPSAW